MNGRKKGTVSTTQLPDQKLEPKVETQPKVKRKYTRGEPEPEPEVKVIIDAVGFARGRELGHKEGFADGIRYIVTLAEGYLAESLELASRHALAESGKLPAWWIATLVKAIGITDLPDDIALDVRDRGSGI